MNSPAATSQIGLWSRVGKGTTRYTWIAGVVLYLGALTYAGWGNVSTALSSLDLRYLAALIAVEILALGLRTLKWRIVLGPNSDAIKLCFLSKGGGNLTPARVGEFAPLLSRDHRSARLGAWIVLDRVLEASATILLGMLGVVVVLGAGRGTTLIAWSLVLMAAMLGILFVLSSRRFADALARKTDQASALGRASAALTSSGVELRALRERAGILIAISFAATALDLVIGLLLFMSFGLTVGLGVLALAQLVHALTSTIPIAPNATGIPYAAAAVVLYEFADIPIELLTTAIGIRFLLGSGVFWSLFLFAVPKNARSAAQKEQGALFDTLAAGTVLYEYAPGALAKLDALVKDKGLLLDVGCGDGLIGEAMDANHTIGFDISRRCATLSRERGVQSAVADATTGLPYASNAFDTVSCIDVLHHLDQRWDPIVAELDRVLRPGGRLCIVEPDARNPFVRWTQAPASPIRVAPWHDEPAIDPEVLTSRLSARGYTLTCEPIHIEGRQTERSVFPLWQRLLKAPFVIFAAWIYRNRPNKFAIVARKPTENAR